MYLLIVKGTYFKNSAVKWSNIRFVMQSSSHNKMWQCAKSAPRPACVPGHFTTRRAYPLPSTQYAFPVTKGQGGCRFTALAVIDSHCLIKLPHSLSFLPVPTPTHGFYCFHPLSTETYRTDGLMFETYENRKFYQDIMDLVNVWSNLIFCRTNLLINSYIHIHTLYTQLYIQYTYPYS